MAKTTDIQRQPHSGRLIHISKISPLSFFFFFFAKTQSTPHSLGDTYGTSDDTVQIRSSNDNELLTPYDLQSTFEHASRVPGTATIQIQPAGPSEIPELCDAAVLSSSWLGSEPSAALFGVFGLLWTLLFVLEHVVQSFPVFFFLLVSLMSLKDWTSLMPYIEKKTTHMSWVEVLSQQGQCVSGEWITQLKMGHCNVTQSA